VTKLEIEIRKKLKINLRRKMFSRDQKTSVTGAMISIILTILNRVFYVTIPDDYDLTIIGLLLLIVFVAWKPKEERKIKYKKLGKEK
jgi:hypothetical protein